MMGKLMVVGYCESPVWGGRDRQGVVAARGLGTHSVQV